MTAWLRRFIHNMRYANNKRNGEISYEEFEKAEKVIIKLVQLDYKDAMYKVQSIIKYTDDEGLIRVKTKLLLTDFPEGIQTPYLISGVKIRPVQRLYKLEVSGSDCSNIRTAAESRKSSACGESEEAETPTQTARDDAYPYSTRYGRQVRIPNKLSLYVK
ncbi:hypothetical protein ACJJTC_006905 [Scirpophaga incertulas]